MIQTTNLEEIIEDYASQPYQTIIEKWDDGDGSYYVARILELPGCMIHGDTPEGAVRDLEGAKRDWLKTSLELKHEIPKPLSIQNYSGRILVRVPPTTHEDLVRMAELEGVSLNQYMNNVLAQAVGRDMERSRAKTRRRRKNVRKNE